MWTLCSVYCRLWLQYENTDSDMKPGTLFIACLLHSATSEDRNGQIRCSSATALQMVLSLLFFCSFIWTMISWFYIFFLYLPMPATAQSHLQTTNSVVKCLILFLPDIKRYYSEKWCIMAMHLMVQCESGKLFFNCPSASPWLCLLCSTLYIFVCALQAHVWFLLLKAKEPFF